MIGGEPPPSIRIAPAWTLGILAGGFSRRFGSDKAHARLGGRSMLDHAAALAPAGVPVLVATRPDGPGRDAGFPWVADVLPGEGPLSAMAALLAAAATPFVLVVPCDTPLLPPDLGDRLLESTAGAHAVLLSVGGERQSLPVLLSRELRPDLEALLEAGHRRADAYVDTTPCAIVPFERLWPAVDPGTALLNLNRPEDVEAWQRRTGGARVDPSGSD